MSYKEIRDQQGMSDMDHLQAKVQGRGYPGFGPATSQADVMMKKANEPNMYGVDKGKSLEIQIKPEVWVDITSEQSANYEIRNIPNDQAIRVVRDVLPKALELYLKKSKDYGGNVMSRRNLGIKACIPDINRKFEKLIDAIWYDKPMQFEQPAEILMDLLGHILIILDEMEQHE